MRLGCCSNLTQDSTSLTDEAMSPLRRRMIEDMTIRKLAAKTQHGYIRTIKNFAVFLGRSPDTASFEDVRRFQLHLAESGADTPTLQLAAFAATHRSFGTGCIACQPAASHHLQSPAVPATPKSP